MFSLAPAAIKTLAALSIAAALAYAGWVVQGWRTGKAQAEQQLADAITQRDAQAAARRIQAQLAARNMRIADAKAAENRSIDARLAAAVAGLRDRPSRAADLPGAPASDCQGADGRGLARPDAEFLAGYAAAAARQQAALRACYAESEPVTGAAE